MDAGAAPAARWGLVALGWLAGVGWQLQQAELAAAGPRRWVAAAALSLGVVGWLGRRRAPGWVLAALVTAAAALGGWASTDERAAWRLAQTLPAELEGEDLVVTGVVDELPRAVEGGTRFVLAVESARRGAGSAPVALPPRLSLGWYAAWGGEAAIDALAAGPPEALRAGQRWRMTLRLQRPHGSMNPQGFDLELWLFERGIGAGGSVRTGQDAAPPVKLAEDAGRPVERLRQRVRDGILLRVSDPAAAGVVAALAVGDQAAIDRQGWDLFRATGVAHLMSISGLHVTIIGWLGAAVVGWAWRSSPRALLACPAPQAARWSGLVAATAYAVLAGWGVPAQRTVGMIAVVALLRGAGLRWPLHAVLLAAALAVAVADPWAMLQPGFWLSFAAVGLLAAAEPAQPPPPAAGALARLRKALRDGLRSQAVATAGLAPLTLVFFQQLSLVGFAANLVAIPVVTLAVTPLALAGMLLPPAWTLAAWGVQGLTALLQALAALPAAVWWAAAAPAWAVACGLLAGVLAVLPLPWKLRALALPLALPLLAPPVARPPAGRFELVAADVGQGTAVLVRTHAHLLVFDTGPGVLPGSDAGTRVLAPLLRARGEPRIDALVLSHRDSDHVGGAAVLLAQWPVGRLVSSLADDHPLRTGSSARVPHTRCDAGLSWQWDGVRFDFLHPTPADHADPAVVARPNALSCVLRVQGAAGPATALLTGDVEAAQEAAILARAGAAVRADVLLVPHHGSRTSSTAAFIDTVAPRVAVVQAGYRNRYGHPAPDVARRYAERGIAVVRSDGCGAWTLAADGSAHCQRWVDRRYWHHRIPD